jgi:hypothetical protein
VILGDPTDLLPLALQCLPRLRPDTSSEVRPEQLTMKLDKQSGIDQPKKQGENEQAQKALNEIPAKLDHR